MGTREGRGVVVAMGSGCEEAGRLSCNQVATCHPELRCELHICERTVVRCLADLHNGRTDIPALSVIQRCVTVIAPSLLVAVQTYDDKLTLQSACRQFRQMSERLLPKIPNGVSATDTQFAFNA